MPLKSMHKDGTLGGKPSKDKTDLQRLRSSLCCSEARCFVAPARRVNDVEKTGKCSVWVLPNLLVTDGSHHWKRRKIAHVKMRVVEPSITRQQISTDSGLLGVSSRLLTTLGRLQVDWSRATPMCRIAALNLLEM